MKLNDFIKQCVDDCVEARGAEPVNAHVRPEPKEGDYLRTVRMEADRIAAEYAIARGWDCTGWDLVKVWADIEAARVKAGGK